MTTEKIIIVSENGDSDSDERENTNSYITSIEEVNE